MTNDDKDPDVQTHTPLVPEIRRSLTDAIRAGHAAKPALRHRRRLTRRGVTITATATVVVAGTALAATTPWAPSVGAPDRGHPSIATTDVPDDQLERLAVLRREQAAADRSPAVQHLLARLSPDVIDGVRLPSVRAVSTRSDGTTAVLAAERTADAGHDQPSDVQRDVVCLLHGTDRSDGRRSPTGPGPAIVGQRCGTTHDLDQGRMLLGGQLGQRLELTGLVPDGVARVELVIRRTGATVAAPVTDNHFRIDAQLPRGAYEHSALRWLDPAGNEVERAK